MKAERRRDDNGMEARHGGGGRMKARWLRKDGGKAAMQDRGS